MSRSGRDAELDRRRRAEAEAKPAVSGISGTVDVSSSALPTGASTSALQTANNTLVGAVNETAPGTDTASSGLNGRLQRIAQRITSLISALSDGTQKSKVTNGTNDAQVRQVSTNVVSTDYGLVTNAVIHGLSSAGGGTYVDVKVTPSGAVNVAATQDGTWNVTNISGTISLPTGAATSALQTTGNNSLSSIDGKLPALTVKNAVPVALGDGAHLDAFSRLRVSMPVTMFESIQRYGDNLLKWETALAGTGSSTFNAAEAGVLMSTGGTASGASAVRMGRQHIRYLAGKSMLWFHTFRMGTHKTDVQVNVGAAMTNGTATIANAVLFRRGVDKTLYFLVVSDATSTAGDDIYDQANWNLDTLDGNGPSGITLDTENTTLILVLDLQWLGVGRVRVGFDIGGVIVYAHEFNHANDPAYAGVYMRTASLAPYLSIRNQALLGSSLTGTEGTLLHICTSVLAEGADDQYGPVYPFSWGNGVSGIGVTTRRPVLSIRAATTGPNSVRNLGLILPTSVSITPATNAIYWELVLNGTLTGAGWAAVDATYSLAERDYSASAISGGIVVASGHIVANAGVNPLINLPKDLALVYTARGNIQETISLVCTSTTGTSTVRSAFNWNEAGI